VKPLRSLPSAGRLEFKKVESIVRITDAEQREFLGALCKTLALSAVKKGSSTFNPSGKIITCLQEFLGALCKTFALSAVKKNSSAFNPS